MTSNPAIVSSLEPAEAQLVQCMDMVQVPGKRINTVPILLIPDEKATINILEKMHAAVGIPASNLYYLLSYSELVTSIRAR